MRNQRDYDIEVKMSPDTFERFDADYWEVMSGALHILRQGESSPVAMVEIARMAAGQWIMVRRVPKEKAADD